MKITTDLLKQHNACKDQRRLFASLYPDGLEPTVENLSDAAAEGLSVWWAVKLLPPEGPGSRRAYALWCARQVQHMCDDLRVAECLDAVERRVTDPLSVSDGELAAARAAARAAAQIACLSQLLLEAE